MFMFLFDVFCKDTAIGLCQIEAKSSDILFRNNYDNRLFKSNYVKNNFENSFTIDQTLYHF